MVWNVTFAALVLSSFGAQAVASDSPTDSLSEAQLRAFNGPFEHVVCTADGDVAVRGPDLRTQLFQAENHSRVKLFQGWDETKKQLDGATYVKVQFPEKEEAVGWVLESLVRPRSRCNGAIAYSDLAEDVKAEFRGGRGSPRGLKDPNCCEWPLKGDVTADFVSGQRKFGAGRGGRTHAACDLYRYKNEPVLSVSSGHVLRPLYFFYQGTYALEVRHTGGFVVRYGEVNGRAAAGISGNAPVRAGQVLGYMGKVNSNCCEPMLHFELYSGAREGSLSGSGRFRRRADLLNPTSYLQKWRLSRFRARR